MCSCLSGKQVVGCCVHVTEVLFYLGHVKNNLFKPGIVSSPAKYLNQILVNIDNKEISNNPRYFRNKRNYLKAIKNKENHQRHLQNVKFFLTMSLMRIKF